MDLFIVFGIFASGLKLSSPGSNAKICVSVLFLLLLLLPILLGLFLHIHLSSTEEPYVILLEAKGDGKVEFSLPKASFLIEGNFCSL